jgi:hypothetical protein
MKNPFMIQRPNWEKIDDLEIPSKFKARGFGPWRNILHSLSCLIQAEIESLDLANIRLGQPHHI